MTALLITNGREIAIRIARAARRLDLPVVGVCAHDDQTALHTRVIDQHYMLAGSVLRP